MTPRDHRSLMNKGRFSGWTTQELYQALESHHLKGPHWLDESLDGTSFHADLDAFGNLVLRPDTFVDEV